MKAILLQQNSQPEAAMKLRWEGNNTRSIPFSEMCAQFPDLVIDYRDGYSPPWGSAVYAENEIGECQLKAENWDTSD